MSESLSALSVNPTDATLPTRRGNGGVVGGQEVVLPTDSYATQPAAEKLESGSVAVSTTPAPAETGTQPPPPPVSPTPVVTPPPVPSTLTVDEEAVPLGAGSAYEKIIAGTPAPPSPDLGSGFPLAPPAEETRLERIHDVLAGRLGGLYNLAMGKVLGRLSETTQKSVGVNVEDLLTIQRTLFQALAPSKEGYTGAPPLFQQLAEGQACFVYLGPDRTAEADLLMRSMPTITDNGVGNDQFTPVRQALLDRQKAGQFPVYIDLDGKLDPKMNTVEEIAAETIASLTVRHNSFGDDFADPKMYFKWLVTRVDSQFRQVDPWLALVRPQVHESTDQVKDALTPAWISGNSQDPDGSRPLPQQVQTAYHTVVGWGGGGAPPTFDKLTEFADGAIGLDRDLLTFIQTYWMKMLREVSPAQRQSLFQPLAKAWVTLNLVAPQDRDQFAAVSPPHAPNIALVDKHTGNKIVERYDRAMALSEVVDHTLDALGIDDRRAFRDVLMNEIRAHQPQIEARESRMRALLGAGYQGIDVAHLVNSDRDESKDVALNQSLQQLRNSLHYENRVNAMTTERAEVMRHRDMLAWVANRLSRYGDVGFHTCHTVKGLDENPLFVSEFYDSGNSAQVDVSSLPPGPSQVIKLGNWSNAAARPLSVTEAYKGGGGKGSCFGECMVDGEGALQNAPIPIQVVGFKGNSAGAITALLRAAGYTAAEIPGLLEQIDFTQFYGDAAELQGGPDPKVRSANQTGLFSMQSMYKKLHELVSKKLNVSGRPILFRDLPFKLEMRSTNFTTNIPPALKEKLGIADDGEVVFSDENTPNMDVIAAACASAAVPAFFNSPQMLVWQQRPGQEPTTTRMQFMDGGLVNNFPIADRSGAKQPLLVVLPAYYDTAGPPPLTLTTLDFSTTNLPPINANNRQRYAEMTPNLGGFLAQAYEQGADHVTLAFNLVTEDMQTAPVVQGKTRAETNQLLALAQQAGFPTLSADQGAQVVKDALPNKTHDHIEATIVNHLVGKEGILKADLLHAPSYHPPQHEAQNIGDVIVCAAGASLAAPARLQEKLFEQG